MKKISFTIGLLLLVLFGYSQHATLKGRVAVAGEGIPYVTIQLEGKDYFQGVTTDQNGQYQINTIPAGNYTLKVSRLGYQTITTTVTLLAKAVVQKDLELQEDRLNLEQVVVSATRYNLDRKEAPVMVKVLDSELFNATQSFALAEGLSFQPGVRVETNCQNCGFTQVRLNGLDGSYSQILINSRPVFSALNSVYGLEQIPTNIIERVEVVRSGGSALYGSNAIAGTINIIIREPVENTWAVNSNFGLIDGEVADNTINFNTSLVSEDLSSGVTFYGMFRDRNAYDANGDGFTELTALANNTFGAKAFFKPNQHHKITVDFNAIREYRRGGDRLHLAPHFTDITEELDHNTIFSGLTYDYFSKNKRSKLSAYLSTQITQRDSYYGGLGGGRMLEDSLAANNAYGTTEDLALVGGVQLTHYFPSEDILTLGLESQINDVEDNIPGYERLIDQRVNATGLYGQYEWRVTERFKALIGARFDRTVVDGFYDIGNIERRSDVTTNVFSPRLTLLYDLMENLQFRGGYARGFRAPQAFNEDLHISSVGGEPQFVILAEDLDKELSDAYTASLSYAQNLGKTQTAFLLEGFYTQLRNPFTIVSTGSVLPNGSILEEVRNGAGAYVAGTNFEASLSPSKVWLFQLGGTVQQTGYEEAQVLFEPEEGSAVEETVVRVEEFIRNPNLYGYCTTNWTPDDHWQFDLTGVYTGSMIVPRVVSETGFLDLVETNSFMEVNLKTTYHFHVKESFHLELSSGVQNLFNSFQDDFDVGPGRDSDYVYGPARPRTFFIGLKIGNSH